MSVQGGKSAGRNIVLTALASVLAGGTCSENKWELYGRLDTLGFRQGFSPPLSSSRKPGQTVQGQAIQSQAAEFNFCKELVGSAPAELTLFTCNPEQGTVLVKHMIPDKTKTVLSQCLSLFFPDGTVFTAAFFHNSMELKSSVSFTCFGKSSGKVPEAQQDLQRACEKTLPLSQADSDAVSRALAYCRPEL